MSKQRPSTENFEPFEMNNPIPWPVIAVALTLAAWGLFTLLTSYMAANENQEQTQALSQQAGAETSSDTGNAQVASRSDSDTDSDGAALFDNYCASCHQNNGAGISRAVPPLMGSAWVLGSGEQTASILLFGIRGPISVQGQTYNGRMPTFGNTLNDHEIAAIVSHIRSTWGNSANSIDADLVRAQRERFSDRDQPWQGGAELTSRFNPAQTGEKN
ncbi:MAG: cytochrome c [Marinobacter sp.]